MKTEFLFKTGIQNCQIQIYDTYDCVTQLYGENHPKIKQNNVLELAKL